MGCNLIFSCVPWGNRIEGREETLTRERSARI